MDYKILGSTGVKLSSVSFGVQTFGWNIFGKEAHELLDIYVEAGGNYLDTADSYNDGASEEILGQWLRARGDHENLVVGTKTFFPTGPGPNQLGSSRKHVCASVERSLKRLGVEAIDLLQLHCFDYLTALDDILLTMEDLVRSGKIRYYGLSNYLPSALMKAVMIQQHRNFHRIASLQMEYSLLVRGAEWELLPVCAQEGIGTLAWSPLAGGWLTGKYQLDAAAPENSRVGRKDRWDDQAEQRGGERTWRVLDALGAIAGQRGVPVSQVALNWLRKKPAVTSVLMGARTPEQMRGNLACVDWNLTDEEESALDQVSHENPPYPFSFINNYARK